MVRYSTAGASNRENAQPLIIHYIKGTLAVAHNGNLTNAVDLREKLKYSGAIFQTTIDSETIAYYIARERVQTKNVQEAVSRTMDKIEGAYALAVMSPRKLIGARDPYGFKPLCIGKRDNTYFLSSETCALDAVGAGIRPRRRAGRGLSPSRRTAFSPTNRTASPPKSRGAAFLSTFISPARTATLTASTCIPRVCLPAVSSRKIPPWMRTSSSACPESGNAAAQGYAMESGIPYGTAFVKNNYVGRTFIKPKQSSRESSVRVKLNVLREVVKDKRVILIDDSIVRGTTSDQIVNMLKDAGAKEVHMRISSPPFLWPCYFGIDVPERHQLIAYNHTVDEICKEIGADTLGYLRLERLPEMVNGLGICTGCFTGDYPIPAPEEDIRGEYEA